MTVTEMITRFEKNMKELVDEIRELDTTITAKNPNQIGSIPASAITG